MGHREQLLAGARRCLYTRGYSRTTARDIVAASNTNLASIGYHFGSKEQLLAAALVAAFEDWGREIETILSRVADDRLWQRVELFVAAVLDSFDRHRALWAAGVEALALMDHQPQLRSHLAENYEHARPALGALLLPAGTDEQLLRAAGSVVLSSMTGLAAQCLVDRKSVPPAPEMIAALTAAIVDAAPPGATAAVKGP